MTSKMELADGPSKRSFPDGTQGMLPSKKPRTLHSVAQERYRISWDEQMGFSRKSVRYNKTSVLLLSWEEHYDDLKVKPEVCSRVVELQEGRLICKPR